MNNSNYQSKWRWGSVKRTIMNYYIKNPDTKPIVAIRDITKYYPYKDKKTGKIDIEKRKMYTSDRKKMSRIIKEFWDLDLLIAKGTNKSLISIIKPGLENYYFEKQKIPPGKKLKLNKNHPLFEDYKKRYC